MIQGHRGGFKPDNTMATFNRSMESGQEAIELDVWLCKDGIPVVSHGGDDGNLKEGLWPPGGVHLRLDLRITALIGCR